jgi:hypothetical protein
VGGRHAANEGGGNEDKREHKRNERIGHRNDQHEDGGDDRAEHPRADYPLS